MKKLGTLVALLWMVGCISHPTSEFDYTDETQAVEALEDPYAMLGTNDESVAFSDQDIMTIEDGEETAEDPYAPANVDESDEPTTPDCDVYSLLIRWGQLTGFNRNVTGVTNWNGSIQANVGKLSVIKTVAFDREDYLEERTDEKLIEFVSHTRPHFDGLRIRYEVCDTDRLTLVGDETPTLTFDASNAVLVKSYTESELEDLNELVENVNANGDRFHALAIKKTDLCQGTLQGDWYNVNGNYGIFRGIVVASNGLRVGYVKGVFGQTKDGESRWVAKFISHQGRFGGMMKGSYADNSFNGDILGKEKEDIGNVEGSFVQDEAGVPGTFSANYTMDCANVPSDEE